MDSAKAKMWHKLKPTFWTFLYICYTAIQYHLCFYISLWEAYALVTNASLPRVFSCESSEPVKHFCTQYGVFVNLACLWTDLFYFFNTSTAYQVVFYSILLCKQILLFPMKSPWWHEMMNVYGRMPLGRYLLHSWPPSYIMMVPIYVLAHFVQCFCVSAPSLVTRDDVLAQCDFLWTF